MCHKLFHYMNVKDRKKWRDIMTDYHNKQFEFQKGKSYYLT